MKKSLASFLPSPDLLLQTIGRFSPTLLLLVVIFFVALSEMHNIGIPGIGDHMGEVILSLIVSAALSVSITFISESRQWRDATKLITIIAASTGIFLYYFFTPYSLLTVSALIFAITALLLLVSPSLVKGDDPSFWLFNRDFYLGTFLAGCASILFALAILMGLLAIEKLFGIKRLVNNTVGELWLIVFVLMIPIYALSWAPTQFKYKFEDCNGYPALNFAINWLLIPIAIIYLVILYAYFGKIALTQEIPKSILSSLIIGFSVFGIVIHMISWPMIKTSRAVALFSRFLFPLLVIPTSFLWYSIALRVNDYGITELRYLIICTAVWISLLVILSIAKKLTLRAIPLSLLILLVLATFSPFNAFKLSKNSQEYRLEQLLQENNLLDSGLAIESKQELNFETRKNISTTIEYLLKNHDSQKIKNWFSSTDTSFGKYDAHKLTKHLGFNYVYKSQREDYKTQEQRYSYFYAEPKKSISLEGYLWHAVMKNRCCFNDSFKMDIDGNTIHVLNNDNQTLFSHRFISDEIKKLSRADIKDRQPIIVTINNSTIKAKLVVTRINMSLLEEGSKISNIEADMYYTLK